MSLLKATKKKWAPTANPPQNSCLGCGGKHNRAECRFKSTVCRRCSKWGHLSRVCRAVYPTPNEAAEPVNKRKKAPGHRKECFAIGHDYATTPVAIRHAFASVPANKIYLMVDVEGAPCRMEIDTGSSKSLIAWATLKELLLDLTQQRLQPCRIKLKDYQGKPILTLGCGTFHISHDQFSGCLPLIMVRDKLPSLLGLDCCPAPWSFRGPRDVP